MKRVTGIGGVFFKCADPAATREWYRLHLGLETDEWGWMWKWAGEGCTQWSTFAANTDKFDTGQQEFMLNYRVADLPALLAALKAEGVTIVGEMEEYPYGKFGWIIDCDGRKVELWQPEEGGF